MALAADVLGVARLVAATVFPGALARGMAAPEGSPVPLLLFGIAAVGDFLDGVLARRVGEPSAHGAVLDSAADGIFVLAASGSGAALGLVPWAAPLAIAGAFAAYVAASVRRSARGGALGLARSPLGHAAGVANYALAGLIACAAARPGSLWAPWLRAVSLGVVALNAAAVLGRVAPRT